MDKIYDVKKIKEIKDFELLIDCYDDFLCNFCCKPDRDIFPYPKAGTILDEEKSVRWNREEVERLRIEFGEEVKRLNKLKTEISKAYEDQIIRMLAKKYKITIAEAEIIYSYSYDKGHSGGVRDVIIIFGEFVDTYSQLKDLKKKG